MHTYKTIVFDFDSTLIKSESLDKLAAIALRDNPDRREILVQIEAITAQGMAGEIGFDESLARRLRLFRANKQHVAQLITESQHDVSASVQRNSAWFLQNSHRIYVISGGFADYIEPIVAQFGIGPDHVFANRFVYDEHGYITGFKTDSPLCQSKGKARQLEQLQLARPLVMIGDGHTDYEVKAHGQADQFWALVENVNRSTVTARADRVLADFAEAMR